jgi:hypothetical protein
MNGKAKARANGTTGFSDDAKRKLREERRAARGTGSIADWSSCDAGLLRELLGLVAGCGFALMVGYTRDRGAYTIRVVGDDAAEPVYVRATEEIDTALQDLIFIYGG